MAPLQKAAAGAGQRHCPKPKAEVAEGGSDHARSFTALPCERRPRRSATPQQHAASAMETSLGQPSSLVLGQTSGFGVFTALFSSVRRPHKAVSPGYCARATFPTN